VSDNILNFKFGIPGLPKDLKKFQLVAVEKDSPFFLLRSVDELSVCFVLIDPFYFFPDYQVELPDQEQKELELHDFQDAAVFCILNMSKGLTNATVNLMAPIVVNVKTGCAKQVILTDSKYDIRHPLPLKQHACEKEQSDEKEADR